MNLGPMEIVVILAVALFVVGPARLPGIARTVGQGVRKAGSLQTAARDALNDVLSDDDEAKPVAKQEPAA